MESSRKNNLARFEILSSSSSNLTAISLMYPFTWWRYDSYQCIMHCKIENNIKNSKFIATFIMSFRMRCESTRTAFFLTDAQVSLRRAYIFSVHGSKRLGNRTAKSPSAIVQLERTISECALSTTVKRSWRFASLKTIHLEVRTFSFHCKA